MNRLQLVIVLETSTEEGTDALYFHSVLDYFFERRDLYGNEVNIVYVYLHGKQNYNSDDVLSQINNYTSMFNDWESERGETHTIYCLDTDSIEKVFKTGSFFKNVQDFCESNKFDLVWFCKNVENVFLGVEPQTLPNKLIAALTFFRSGKISKIKEFNLCKKEIEIGCSNIISVLSQYLKRKNEE